MSSPPTNPAPDLAKRSTTWAYLNTFVAVFLFATIELTSKFIQGSFSFLQQNCFRNLLGVALLGGILAWRRPDGWRAYFRANWKLLASAGGLWIALSSTTFFYALTLTRASNAALLLSSNPIVVSLFAMWLFGEKRSKRRVGAAILGFAGAFVVITEFRLDIFAQEEFLGNLLAFLPVFGWTFYTLAGRRVETPAGLPKFDASLLYTLGTFGFGVLFMTPFTIIDTVVFHPLVNVPASAIGGLLYLGLVTTGVAYIFYNMGIHHIEASRGILLFYTKPLITMVLAWLLLGEDFTLYFFIGFFLILVAVLLTSLETARPAAGHHETREQDTAAIQ